MQVIKLFALSCLCWMPPTTVVGLESAPCGNRTGVGRKVLHSGSGASLSFSELAGSVAAQVQVCPKIVGHRPGALCPPASVGTLVSALLPHSALTVPAPPLGHRPELQGQRGQAPSRGLWPATSVHSPYRGASKRSSCSPICVLLSPAPAGPGLGCTPCGPHAPRPGLALNLCTSVSGGGGGGPAGQHASLEAGPPSEEAGRGEVSWGSGKCGAWQGVSIMSLRRWH